MDFKTCSAALNHDVQKVYLLFAHNELPPWDSKDGQAIAKQYVGLCFAVGRQCALRCACTRSATPRRRAPVAPPPICPPTKSSRRRRSAGGCRAFRRSTKDAFQAIVEASCAFFQLVGAKVGQTGVSFISVPPDGGGCPLTPPLLSCACTSQDRPQKEVVLAATARACCDRLSSLCRPGSGGQLQHFRDLSRQSSAKFQGAVMEKCKMLETVPRDNRTATSRALVRLGSSIKDVVRELGTFSVLAETPSAARCQRLRPIREALRRILILPTRGNEGVRAEAGRR